MNDATAKALLVIGCVAGIGALTFFVLTQLDQSDGPRLQPGTVPITAIPTPAGESPSANPCRFVAMYAFHLRPQEQPGWEGSTEYPRGTEAQILRAGSLRRNGALMMKVRVARDGREGWAYVLPGERRGDCAATTDAEIAARATAAASPNAART